MPPAATMDEEVERQVLDWRNRIAELPGNHRAIQVLWDGDTTGWFVRVFLVSEPRVSWWTPWAAERARCREDLLAGLRYGGDIRLFNGQVPPWPEAIVARRAGERVARDLGLEFYFPSPDDPDSDCPSWVERESATRCRACGKLLLAKPYHGTPPRCYLCKLNEERERAILNDAPGTIPGVRYVLEEEPGHFTQGGFFSLGDHASSFASALASVLNARPPPVALSAQIDTYLSPGEVAVLRLRCEKTIDALLTAFRAEEKPPFPEHVFLPHRFTWKGQEQTIEVRFSPKGREIHHQLNWHAFLCACTPPRRILIVGNGGLTHRDVSFLCLLRARGRTMTMPELAQAFPFLPAPSMEATLMKLEGRGLLSRSTDGLHLQPLGALHDVAGP